MLATLTRPSRRRGSRRALGSASRRSSGTRPARRAARASSAIAGISLVVGAVVVGVERRRPRPRRRRSPGSRPSAARRGSSAAAGGVGADAEQVVAPRRRPRPAGLGRRLVDGRGSRRRAVSALGDAASATVSAAGSALGGSASASTATSVGDGLGSARLDAASARLGRPARRRRPASRPTARRVERRRLGQALGHGGEAGRVVLGEQALEERGHLGLEGGRPAPGRARCAPRSTAAWSSISRSRSVLRWAMRSSVSSRIRAISALDQSRIGGDVVVGRACAGRWPRRRSRRGCASMCALASAAKRSSVSARAASAAACMALVRSAMNLFGLRRGRSAARGEVAAGVGSAAGREAGVGGRRVVDGGLVVGSGGRGVDHGGRLGLLRRGWRRRARSASAVAAASASAAGRRSVVVAIRAPREPEPGSWRRSWPCDGSSLTELAWRRSGRGGIVPARFGVVESARGTSGARRSYRRRRRCRRGRCAGRDGVGATMVPMDATPRWPPRSADTPRPAAARPAHLGHRPLQLPLHVLHAQGGLRARLRVPAARPGPVVRGDRAGGPGLRRRSASRSCGSPAASRSSGATCRTSSRCWRAAHDRRAASST